MNFAKKMKENASQKKQDAEKIFSSKKEEKANENSEWYEKAHTHRNILLQEAWQELEETKMKVKSRRLAEEAAQIMSYMIVSDLPTLMGIEELIKLMRSKDVDDWDKEGQEVWKEMLLKYYGKRKEIFREMNLRELRNQESMDGLLEEDLEIIEANLEEINGIFCPPHFNSQDVNKIVEEIKEYRFPFFEQRIKLDEEMQNQNSQNENSNSKIDSQEMEIDEKVVKEHKQNSDEKDIKMSDISPTKQKLFNKQDILEQVQKSLSPTIKEERKENAYFQTSSFQLPEEVKGEKHDNEVYHYPEQLFGSGNIELKRTLFETPIQKQRMAKPEENVKMFQSKDEPVNQETAPKSMKSTESEFQKQRKKENEEKKRIKNKYEHIA